MKVKAPLRQIASARAGDKGNISSIGVWVYDPRHYADVKAQLTAERVKNAYPRLFQGKVERHAVDELHGLNFVLHDALEGGVNSSLNLDTHGKSFSFLLLALEVEIELLNDPVVLT
ncbi:hypothetical protein [Bradyrhizobium sp.]|uniref:AtuA-related protein n=1 Tax=Bradyrhizobium sp. TaxID=376 RepID=UPI0039E39EAD